MANWKIRDYKQNDEAEVAHLLRSTFSESPWNEKWSYPDARNEIRIESSDLCAISLVAAEDSKIVGFRFASPLPIKYREVLRPVLREPAMYGVKLGVHRNFRKQGIARGLMEETIERVKSAYPQIIGRTKNFAAMTGLYESLGYVNTRIKDPNDPLRVFFGKNF